MCDTCWYVCPRATPTHGSRTLDSQQFKSGVSHPRIIAHVHLEKPFESSNLPGAGPIFPDRASEKRPCPWSQRSSTRTPSCNFRLYLRPLGTTY